MISSLIIDPIVCTVRRKVQFRCIIQYCKRNKAMLSILSILNRLGQHDHRMLIKSIILIKIRILMAFGCMAKTKNPQRRRRVHFRFSNQPFFFVFLADWTVYSIIWHTPQTHTRTHPNQHNILCQRHICM